jgi:signal transduction histidine kinase/sensor domain CHASE-containing protein
VDWAARTDSRAFVQVPNSDYIETYLEDSTFAANRLNMVVFADSSGDIIYEQSFDLPSSQKYSAPTGIALHLQPGSVLLEHAHSAQTQGGLLLLPTGPMLVVSAPISGGPQGPIMGVVVLGRFLNQAEMRRLADTTQSLLSTYFFEGSVLPGDVMVARAHLSRQKSLYIQAEGANDIAGYSLLVDIYGDPVLILKVTQSRYIYEQGRASMWYFVLALLASGVVFGVMTMLLLEQAVLSRLAKLSVGVNRVRKSNDLSLRVTATGKDELGQLAHAVNGMLIALEQSEKVERQQRLAAETLRRTAETLAASFQLEDTLHLIIDLLKRIISFDRALIGLVEDEALHIAKTNSFAGSSQINGKYYPPDAVPLLDEGLDQPVVIPDVIQDPRWVAPPGFESFAGTWVSVPLTTHSVAIGLLCIASEKPAAYSPQDLEALLAFAQQAALAVENARVLTQLETSLLELRETQTRLARTARLSAAGEIAAGVAHQINNPLTTVIAETHLLKSALDSQDAHYESVEAIQQAAERAAQVVQRMLDLTRVHDYVMEPVNINESLQNSITLLRAQLEPHLARFEVQLTPRLPLVNASRQHLEDVWLNLLLNARDAVFPADNGMIRITSGFDSAANVVRVTVQDNGPGIPPDRVKSVFEPFFTTKDSGTGLGLSICRDVVIRHGGQISVESTEGQGTRFTITLPPIQKTGAGG